MRNKSKKLIAIMAAMMIAGSTVAATASVSVSAIDVNPSEETKVTLTDNQGQPLAGVTIDKNATDVELYTDNKGTKLDLTKATYDFGNAVEPMKNVDLYVKLTKDSDSKYVKLNASVTYKDNVNASTNTATATIKIDQTQDVEFTSGTATVVRISGTIVKKFDIKKYDFSNAVLAKAVKVAWTGGDISINKTDLQLQKKNTAADGVSVYYTPIDPSLYTVTKVGSVEAKEKNGVVTFKYTGVPAKLDATYNAASNNANIGTADATAAIEVEKANWNNVVVTVNNQTSISASDVVVTLNGNKLTKDTHYTIESVKPADSSNTVAQVVLKPDGNYFTTTDTVTYYANVTTNIASKIASVYYTDRANAKYTYTGEAIKPAVTVNAVTGTTLTEGVDYEVVYNDNVKVGTGKTAVIKGIGVYAGEFAVPGTFTIEAKKLSDTTITAADVTYETTAPTKVDELAKAITVKNGDKVLEYGEDYQLVLNNATIKDGANALRVLPKNNTNYVGIANVTVNVKKVTDLSTATISKIANVVYTGAEVKPGVAVMLGDKTLVEGTDYTVAYTNNVETGLATATVTGTGAYKGTISKNFVIVPQKVTGLKAKKKTTTTLKLTFNAVHGADGYKIYDAATGKALASVSTQGGKDVLTKTIKGLNPGEKRQYKVRAYKVVNGTKRYAAYSDIYTKATAAK